MQRTPAASTSTPSARGTVLRVSGAADRFHRVGESRSRSPKTRSSIAPNVAAVPSGDPNPFPRDNNATNDDSSQSTREIPSPTYGNAPNLQNIDRAEGGLPTIAGSGLHMPPEVLGRAEDNCKTTQDNQTSLQNPENNKKLTVKTADLNKAARRRSFLAVKAIKSPAAMKAVQEAVKGVTSPSNNTLEGNIATNSSMFTTVIYGGMEVVFSYVISHQAIAGVCSRTNFLFQKLNLMSKTPVVSITSNASSGMIIVAHEDGVIQTYIPVETETINIDESKRSQQRPKSAFGKFRWIDGIVVNAAEVFYTLPSNEKVQFCDRRQCEAGRLIDISSSYDYKLLVAHRQQLAVFDVFPVRGFNENDDFKKSNTATLLWTTVLPWNVVSAKISGDGQALVVVTDRSDDRGNYGAMTFLHDKDDGSTHTSGGVPTTSIGMVFRPGPFLKHAKPVTRLSFRGLGHVTPSANPEKDQGNDLLLTYCEEDSTARIFNQNSWRQLMLWTTPPRSRADWIRGSSAFSLGDLEPQLKSNSSRGPQSGRGRPNSVSSGLSSETGSISSGFQSAGGTGIAGTASPTSDAGAWIAEITFRGAYPALRLSRLSYMKRGNDDSQPAHFESIAAILPAGSIIAESVLNADDMGLSVQGIWSAWNPWLSKASENKSDNTLGGSAMKFLGLSSVPPPGKNQGTFGEYYSGGTHSPPTELRLVTSHPENGQIVLMDFPLWGEDDFGAMELGSPIRHVWALNAIYSLRNKGQKKISIGASVDYESSRLCAEVVSEGGSISLYWRREGCMSPYSMQWQDEAAVNFLQNRDSISPITPDLIYDMSLIHVPLALPPLKLPTGSKSRDGDSIVAIKWWLDDSFGGPPLLVAITASGTIIVYEIPPPLFALEPSMPNFDSSNPPSSVASANSPSDNTIAEVGSDDEDLRATMTQYDVLVTPHPDFGLGLRLESPMDGLPAIAGSFKKNPLNDGILPAEKTGMIQLGDELLSVNGVNLENKTFDDIIATVRHVGAALGPGKPLKMTFRPVPFERSRKNSLVVHESFSVREKDHDENASKGVLKTVNTLDSASLAAMLHNNPLEGQQEFGRIIAVLRKAVKPVNDDEFSEKFTILPWKSGSTVSSSKRLRAAALVLYAYSNKIKVKRVELPAKSGLDKARDLDLGVIDLFETRDKKDNNDNPIVIRKITCTESTSDRWCFIVSDSIGSLTLLYLKLSKKESQVGEGSMFEMSHEQYHIVDMGADSSHFRIHSRSADILAAIDKSESPIRSIKVWHSRPDAVSRSIQSEDAVKDDNFERDYYESTIIAEPSESNSELIDVRFLQTGYLEAFPTIVAFLTSEAIVYQRRGCNANWTSIVRISYPAILTSNWQSDFTNTFGRLYDNIPLDTYPHILRMIGATLLSYDEKNYMLSDWHPENLFTHICTEVRGAKFALKGEVKRIYLWIHDKIDESLDDNLSSNVPLLVAPLAAWTGETAAELDDEYEESKQELESAANLMMSMTIGNATRSTSNENGDHQKLKHLDAALRGELSSSSNKYASSDTNMLSCYTKRSESGSLENNAKDVPEFLKIMNASEMLVLRAILNVVMNPPKYGVLDIPGQLTLTIYSLHKEIQKEEDNNKDNGNKSPSNYSMRGIYVKRSTSSIEPSQAKLTPQNASAGCLSALLSDYQDLILDTIRGPGQKIYWSEIRNLRVPFWLRSDDKLRQLSEEIGQNMYRQTKDILQSAIFFIIAGKKRTLTNLAAADSSLSGRKFHKFLTNYDFSSKRGRVAAEKNAFSLLRKNQYNAASAFFLLPEPPMLNSAVETIATKMEDLDLAFLVARVIGNMPSSSDPITRRGFGGFGGGGGFAGSGPSTFNTSRDKDGFKDWKHHIGGVARNFILDRVLPIVHNDTCLSAVQMLWLGRIDEASNFLTGLINGRGESEPHFVEDVFVPQLRRLATVKGRDSTILTVNSFINLVSGPILLKMMKASKRTRLASTLAVSRSLIKAGIEIPAIRSLMHQMNNETDFEEDDHKLSTSSISGLPPTPAVPSSSIFDSFDGPPPAKPHTSRPPSETVSSSIFDSFDGPPPTKPHTSRPPSETMSSSIFDSFDVQPPSNSGKPTPDQGIMSSSIFDSFDVPPPKAKLSEPTSGAMESSIFDSFDAPSTHREHTKSAPSSGTMESSIFDSFDNCPGATNSNQSKESNDEGFPKASIKSNVEDLKTTGKIRSPARIWIQWRESLLWDAAARRLIRELSTLCAPYYCDKFDQAGFSQYPLISSEASQVLQFHCDGEELIKEVREQVEYLSNISNMENKLLVEYAIQRLHSPHQFHRIFYVVLLMLASNQVELAEDVLRGAAHLLIAKCYSNAFGNNRVTSGRSCAAHISNLVSQKFVAHLSWQLELCLWIHRGGALPLSGLALNEIICSVRIGYFIASRNRDFEVQEVIMRESPDCLVDERAGRQLWSSLKIISGGSRRENKVVGTGSGGWEFLVDCRRARATELLRQKPTGTFIIRPHPQDHGVFTISFKTNLIPSDENKSKDPDVSEKSGGNIDEQPKKSQTDSQARPIKRDDVVQHAIIRLSDSGFRCGSFGPFGTLMDLLEAVSSSLPFDLRFDLPPTEGIIKEDGLKPSPNSAFLRKSGMQQLDISKAGLANETKDKILESKESEEKASDETTGEKERREMFGLFFELLVLHRLRKQLSAVAAAEYDNEDWLDETQDDIDSIGSLSDETVEIGVEQEYAIAARVMRPLLIWCRMLEIEAGNIASPTSSNSSLVSYFQPVSLEVSESKSSTCKTQSKFDGGDSIIRRMIQPDSGVEFRTLRLGDGGENAMVVMFSKKEAVTWFLKAGVETNEDAALSRLKSMEESRVIELVDLQLLAPKSYQKKTVKKDDDITTQDEPPPISGDIRYRLIDPWEVEPLQNREAETKGATLGRNCLLEFSLSRVACCYEGQLKSLGSIPLLELWHALKGGIYLTKSFATVQPPWKCSTGGDLLLRDGNNIEPSIYENAIREHLYRNSLFEMMKLPQRFVALIQVELLDLKNLTSPGGSLSLTVYSLLRLKRARSNAPLTSKARTLDSVSTAPVKLAKTSGPTSGPNAPASWGSLVRFRYPLPENTDIEGKCYDRACESLFKGPPSVLQVSVYEKKFMSDTYLGGADVQLNGLSSGGQLEEWVPLKTNKQSINWFARIRLTLRFELMCLGSTNHSSTSMEKLAPSVGRQRIQQLCSVGGAQFDLKQSVSTPDILTYFESYFETY